MMNILSAVMGLIVKLPLKYLLLVGGLFLSYLKGKSKAKESMKEKTLDAYKNREKVRSKSESVSSDDKRKQLYDDWE